MELVCLYNWVRTGTAYYWVRFWTSNYVQVSCNNLGTSNSSLGITCCTLVSAIAFLA